MAKWIALVAGVAGTLVTGLLLSLPFMREPRLLTASIPQSPPLFATATLPLRPGQSACMVKTSIDDHSERAYIKVGTRRKPAVPLTFTVTAEGHRTTARHPPVYADNDVLAFDIEPPDEPKRGRFCVRNDGIRLVDLYAVDDRTRTRAETFVDGVRVAPNYMLSFTARSEVPFARRFGAIAHRMATFRPGGPWIPWVLVVLVLAGVPLALVLALFRSAADDEDVPR